VATATGAAAALLIGLAACAVPTVTDHALVSQASRSAGSMVSEVRTAHLAAKSQLEGDTWWRYTDVVVTDAESAASTIEDTFGSRQPPSRDVEPTYRKTVATLSEAADLVTDLRIAVRRHDESGIRDLLPRLAAAADALEQLEESLK